MLHAAYARAINARLDPSAAQAAIDNSIRSNPVAQIPSIRGSQNARTRVLTKPEQKEVWGRFQNVDDEVTGIYTRILRLNVYLGGQRLDQLLRVKLSNVDLSAQTIMLFDGKGRRTTERPHLLPILAKALEDIQWFVERSRSLKSEWLFVSNVAGAVINDTTVSRLVTELCKEMLRAGTVTSHFQFSDWRRTIETTLASLGVSKDHRAQLQSHGISGVQSRHYDMYEYMPEKRAALELWESYLKSLSQFSAGGEDSSNRESAGGGEHTYQTMAAHHQAR